MPKIYEYFGLVFLFYANDHRPVHIHVKNGGFENKIEFVYQNGKLINILVKPVAGKKQLPESMIKDAKKLAKIKQADIMHKWFEFFAKKKTPKCEKITKKL